MWEVRIRALVLAQIKHGLVTSVHLTKFNLIAYIFVIFSCSWDKLPVDSYDIALMLLHAVSNHVFNKSIEGLDLLVDHTILFEVGINDFPLIGFTDLVVSEFWLIRLSKWSLL